MYLIEEVRLTIDEYCKEIIMNASTIIIFQGTYFGQDRFMVITKTFVTLSHAKIICVYEYRLNSMVLMSEKLIVYKNDKFEATTGFCNFLHAPWW